ncbi:MAG TPA: hypothetical protein VGM91_12190 [Conexibacter sp.]|jgi:hypothetical protein
MSSPHPTNGQADKPTAKQLQTLRSLALSRGHTFSYPKTRAQASAEIRRLPQSRGQSALDRAIEADELQRVSVPREATAIREDEVLGHGSSARWSHRHPRAAS